MTQGIDLIVGLGNPGQAYTGTRHNAGFLFLDALLEGAGVELRRESRFSAQIARLAIDDKTVWLLAPATFMNHSGEAVVKFAHYYRIAPEQILMVHDDLDLPPGTVRLKQGGGDGGHNGLQDVISRLGSREFVRLRIGIGHPGDSSQVVSYVLKKAPAGEQTLIDGAIQNARAHIGDIVHGRYQQVMNVLHTHGA